ncbi:MAG: FxsA family protein [Gemmatimonadetes bacterium]|nr:MAG: FxsA family protein [Gemmatimonadota bacterium]
MTLLGRLALLFVLVPLLELALLVRLGQWVGFWPTIGLVLFTGVTGAWLARLEGLRALWRVRTELARGRIPAQAALDGVSILVGGAFLLTPGIVTDLAGFGLLFPPTRRWVQERVRRRLVEGIERGTIRMTVVGAPPWSAGSDFAGFGSGAADIVDAVVVDVVDPSNPEPPDRVLDADRSD